MHTHAHSHRTTNNIYIWMYDCAAVVHSYRVHRWQNHFSFQMRTHSTLCRTTKRARRASTTTLLFFVWLHCCPSLLPPPHFSAPFILPLTYARVCRVVESLELLTNMYVIKLPVGDIMQWNLAAKSEDYIVVEWVRGGRRHPTVYRRQPPTEQPFLLCPTQSRRQLNP